MQIPSSLIQNASTQPTHQCFTHFGQTTHKSKLKEQEWLLPDLMSCFVTAPYTMPKVPVIMLRLDVEHSCSSGCCFFSSQRSWRTICSKQKHHLHSLDGQASKSTGLVWSKQQRLRDPNAVGSETTASLHRCSRSSSFNLCGAYENGCVMERAKLRGQPVLFLISRLFWQLGKC